MSKQRPGKLFSSTQEIEKNKKNQNTVLLRQKSFKYMTDFDHSSHS